MNRTETHQFPFSQRVQNVPQSFIREILKVTSNPHIVSFAGGLPSPSLFPVKELEECALRVFQHHGTQALQYAATEGYFPLREYISNRYRQRFNLEISPEQILITNGSQQALDLIGKLFINPGDNLIVERPGYLGALQCFSMFQANIMEVNLENDGINTHELENTLCKNDIKFFYGIPNFQNPTGISYSAEKRKKTAEILARHGTLFIEDDPYGEIAFNDEISAPVFSHLPDQTILIGSFSKIIAPGLRLGWMVANHEIIKKAIILKQATDLHSGNLAQFILYEFLSRYNLDNHIEGIRKRYKQQCKVMLDAIYHNFPFSVSCTRPMGGMFCWLTLPKGLSSRKLLQRALKEDIIFVPGDTFYASNPDTQTLRLNFSNVEEDIMVESLKKLGNMI
ncbi:PLP-dependent aminotransferase family protein [Pedobacter sp. P351]|uniref:aminotransferase-like domain-containing protein n=1 Tax=Pedobacter superstes TaxID=3133441 RepID=UPI0030959303